MDGVKKYRRVDKSDDSTSFRLATMQAIYQERKGEVDEPHRHEFYTILVLKKGQGVHKIDFNAYSLGSFQVFFVAPGQVHQVIEDSESIGFVMTFSEDFLIQNDISLNFLQSLHLFEHFEASPPLQLNEQQFFESEKLLLEMMRLFNSNNQWKELSLACYLKLFLIQCNTICSNALITVKGNDLKHRILVNFKTLVNQFYHREHGTQFYANALHISGDYLNRVVKNKIGETAKQVVHNRILAEAKRLLFFTTLSHKEIAYQLGFIEASHFTAFFKKRMGCTPSAFRRRERS